MLTRFGLALAALLLVGGLCFAPITHKAAAQEDTTTEIDEGSSKGPGAAILIVGVSALLLVGFAYYTRQHNGANV